MFKRLTFFAATTVFTFSSFADQLCEGRAKYGTIKAYKAEMGTVQGSDGIQYGAKILDNLAKASAIYLVGVFDNNEDGEAWTVNYLVKVSKNPKGKCAINSLVKIGVVSEN